MDSDPHSPAEPPPAYPPREAWPHDLLRLLGEEVAAREAAAVRDQRPSLDAVLALAPDAADWARETHAGARELALALALGARFLRAVPPGAPPRAGPAPRPPTSSAGRGAAGEDVVYRALARGRQMRDVSRRAHSGDFVCDTPAGPVHVEVKHHSSAVPAAEVDKFLRDLRETDAAAGVLLSLSSPIAGQRESVAVVLEPRVSAGTLVPVVFAAPPRAGAPEGRLAPDVAVAAVDLAACLAVVYPRGLRGLHGRDSVLAHAAAAEQVADGVCSVRTDLARLAGTLVSGASDLGDRLAALGREGRHLARSQRAEAEVLVEATAAPGGVAAMLRERFEVCAPDSAFAPVVAAVEALASAAGPLGEQNRWRLLKARAVHVPSGCGFAFLKGATLLRVPAERLSAEAVVAALKAHPKKVGVAGGEVSIELDDLTRDAARALLDQGKVPGAPGS